MDVLDGKGSYEKWFRFRETTPKDPLFELLDYADKNFFNNSGSYFVITACLIVFFILLFLINSMAAKCSRFKCCRKLGVHVHEDSYKTALWQSIFKLFVESYFDLVMCAALGLLAFVDEGVKFTDFWQTIDDSVNSSVSILYSIFVVAALFWFFSIITRNLKSLKLSKMTKKYGVLYSDNKFNTLARALYTVFFLWRRFMTVMILVFIDKPFFQSHMLLIASLVNLCYITQ